MQQVYISVDLNNGYLNIQQLDNNVYNKLDHQNHMVVAYAHLEAIVSLNTALNAAEKQNVVDGVLSYLEYAASLKVI